MGYAKGRKYPLPDKCRNSIIEDFKRFFDGSTSNFRFAYQSESLLSKFADPDPASAELRVTRAIAKWRSTETRNMRTNQRLFCHLNGENLLSGRSFDNWISRASLLVKKVIGVAPPYSSLTGEFSGGASTSKRRTTGMVQRKYVGQQDVTDRAWDHVWPHLIGSPVWAEANPEFLNPRFVSSSVLFTVPKNDTINRVACKEPDYNMWAQKAVGNFIRRRLKRKCGVDLNDQSINRGLARDAVRLKLATVDLSSASDSVTTQLVCRLLPTEWFVYLQDIRVHSVLVKDDIHELEMFSSMGNGFTFELESLIFWALTRCVSRGTVSVFGDDIIMPTRDFPVVKTLLNYCGFTVNKEKSFATGLFRESCGGHYYDGTDVTPFYIKSPIVELPHLIRVLNRLRKWASQNGSSAWACSSLWPLWKKYAAYVPRELWGGSDLNSVETLVSKQGPASRLVKVRKQVASDLFERGSYVQWHAVAALRPSSVPVGQQRPSTSAAFWGGGVDAGCTIPEFYRRIRETDLNSKPSNTVLRETGSYVVKRRMEFGMLGFGSERSLFPQECEEEY